MADSVTGKYLVIYATYMIKCFTGAYHAQFSIADTKIQTPSRIGEPNPLLAINVAPMVTSIPIPLISIYQIQEEILIPSSSQWEIANNASLAIVEVNILRG